MAANDRQEGGDHYQQLNGGIQPWDVAIAWGLGFLDGNALKYIARWRRKGGIEDLKKARHYLDKQIEEEEEEEKKKQPEQKSDPSWSLKPVRYSSSEGDDWKAWPVTWGCLNEEWLEKAKQAPRPRPAFAQVVVGTSTGHNVCFHAFQLGNMRVWDCVNGWRDKALGLTS